MSHARSRISPRTQCNRVTRGPCDTVVEESPSVFAIIQHIILCHPRLLYKAIRILTFILYIIPFFLSFVHRAITSPSNPPSPTPLPGPNQTSPTAPRNTPQSQKAALLPTTKQYHLRSHAAGSLIKSQGLSSVHGMCLRGGRGRVNHSV